MLREGFTCRGKLLALNIVMDWRGPWIKDDHTTLGWMATIVFVSEIYEGYHLV